MVAISSEPCAPWDPIWCEALPISAAPISGTMVQIATSVLWAKSGRQFDFCDVTLRPCREDCYGNAWPFGTTWNEWGAQWPYPYNYAGQWFNLGCGGCPGSCSCSVLQSAVLPGPVVQIFEIKVNGSTLTSGSYKVLNHRTLLRTDGQAWPLCNDLNKDDSQPNTWSVRYRIGTEVPALGRLAVGELAAELSKACVGAECALTPVVASLVRQGVSLTFLDPNTVFAEKKVGLFNCDLFIDTFNPSGIPDRARAYDVEGRRPRAVTWPP